MKKNDIQFNSVMQLKKFAQSNFETYKNSVKGFSLDEIFKNSEETYFFNELHDFLTGKHNLEENICTYLCKHGNNLISDLYAYYAFAKLTVLPIPITTEELAKELVEIFYSEATDPYNGAVLVDLENDDMEM